VPQLEHQDLKNIYIYIDIYVCEKESLDGLCSVVAIHDHFSVSIRVVGDQGIIVPDTTRHRGNAIPALSLNKDKLQQVGKADKSRGWKEKLTAKPTCHAY